MIPTSIANSPTATICSVNGGANQNKNNCRNDQLNYTSVILGIASLILEGRPIGDDDYQTHNNRSNASHTDNLSSDNSCPNDGNSVLDGRQSPCPATARTGTSASGCVINITTNPYLLAGVTAPLNHTLPVTSLPCTDSNRSTIESSSSTLSENTHQRWTQKLCQLRKVTPAAQSISSEPELVSLTINDTLNAERTGNDFEIVRRVMLNRANLTFSNNFNNSSLALGSENILHSLQSLATTCLRGGSSTLDSVSTGIHMPLFSPPKHAAISSRFSHNPLLLTTSTTFPTKNLLPKSAQTKRLQHGPHCDQFLRKMGLAKSEIADSEEHFCDMSYVNVACSRWRAYNLKIGEIISRNEPICIEVYLGPVKHKILLEQWIITCKEKMSPPTMTLPSLCSAIRSQLYFSQIVAWCDLLRKSDKSIYDTGRVIFSNSMGSAGDLVMPSFANITTIPPSSKCAHRPRLNIFYRIKQYDATTTDGFNNKPNIHNFPSVNISENISISICVKSLPRINGGIPKVIGPSSSMSPSMHLDAFTSCNASTPTNGGELCAVTPTGLGARISTDDITTPRTSRLFLLTPDVGGIATKSNNNCDNKSQYDPDSLLCAKFKSSQPLLSETRDDSDYFFEHTNGMGNTLISHREKQLQKYRKRMLKRDKKRERKLIEPFHNGLSDDSISNISNSSENKIQPMEQCDDAHGSHSINNSSAQQRTPMVSTGTQTPIACCQQCGREKMLICLTCKGPENRKQILTGLIELDDSSSSCSSTSFSCNDQVNVPSKAEILLQAIQRTPKNRKNTEQIAMSKKNNVNGPYDLKKAIIPPMSLVNNNQSSHKVLPKSGGSCQVCKRQKTQHIFSNGDSGAINEKNTSKTTLLKGITNEISIPYGDICMDVSNNVKENNLQKSYFCASQEHNAVSTRLTPQIDRCTIEEDDSGCRISNFNLNSTSKKCQYLEIDPPDQVNRNDTTLIHFPTPNPNAQNKKNQEVKICDVLDKAKKTNFLQISHDYPSSQLNSTSLNNNQSQNMTTNQISALSHCKGIPKINLTLMFCKSKLTAPASEDDYSGHVGFSHSDAPQDFTKKTHTHSQEAEVSPDLDNNIPVQKSNSAPTLPNSLSLSPRFTKQSLFYKQRSRHLSDRSDRSSLGSDELLSDEDYDGTQSSPATSPIKANFRITEQFGRKPLLGNLEESLLQKRILPKMEVIGFKVLLGASGGFCPTQLTIPAATYFYELYGETLCTPYLCEVRLPRKGYSVPRSGTVQATLLNPIGTVVRMFVIPYDMRDMPPLHRTFIRQRILAEESSINTNSTVNLSQMGDNSRTKTNGKNYLSDSMLGHFITADQMKRLRYSIHLRFQTSRSGRLSLHTDIRLLISRRTDCDTAAAHAKAKGALEAQNELIIDTLIPQEPRYSARQDSSNKI